MKVAIVGHRDIVDSAELRQRLRKTVLSLLSEGADTFYFGSKSDFDSLCYEIIVCLKDGYPFKTVYVRSAFEHIDKSYENYLLQSYDQTIFPEEVRGAGYRSYIKRNDFMIDSCDILLTYFDKNYVPNTKRNSGSGTALAVKYALSKQKRVINLFI